jgi:type I restriction enzyme S subunit
MATEEWCEVAVEKLKAPEENALATGPFGSSISSRYFLEHGVPVIRGSNLSEDVGTRLNDEGLVYLSEEKAAEFKRSVVRKGDLIFTCWGTINQVGLIDKRAKYAEYVISNKQMKLTPDRRKADSLFLYYLFSCSEMQEVIKNQGIGSSVPGFNLGQLRSMRLKVPPLGEQRAIAHILGTLDDKIELKRRMNETLETMARAFFKSWFVDFDPVRAKAEGRDPGLPKPLADLFPDSFEDSELGEIPKGWNMGRFGDVVEQIRDQENPLLAPDKLFHHFSIPAFDEGQSPKPENGESIKSLKSRVPVGVILLSKLNPEIERVWMVDVRLGERAVCSTEFLVLRALFPFTRSYVYCLARSPLFRQQIEGLVTGTSKSHQRAQVNSILNLAVVVPPSSIVAAFDRSTDSLLARTLECRRESRTLAALRDTLLPELISGYLRVRTLKGDDARV